MPRDHERAGPASSGAPDLTELRRWQDECLRKNGFYVHYVPGEDGAINAHTHGFDATWGHPDVQIVLPLPPDVAHGIFWTVRDLIASGRVFKDGETCEGILKNYPVSFARAREGGRDVLRLLLPDNTGALPADARCSERFKKQLTWEGGAGENLRPETPDPADPERN